MARTKTAKASKPARSSKKAQRKSTKAAKRTQSKKAERKSKRATGKSVLTKIDLRSKSIKYLQAYARRANLAFEGMAKAALIKSIRAHRKRLAELKASRINNERHHKKHQSIATRKCKSKDETAVNALATRAGVKHGKTLAETCRALRAHFTAMHKAGDKKVSELEKKYRHILAERKRKHAARHSSKKSERKSTKAAKKSSKKAARKSTKAAKKSTKKAHSKGRVTGYILYVRRMYRDWHKADKEMTRKAAVAKAAPMWKALSEDEQAKYVKAARAMNLRNGHVKSKRGHKSTKAAKKSSKKASKKSSKKSERKSTKTAKRASTKQAKKSSKKAAKRNGWNKFVKSLYNEHKATKSFKEVLVMAAPLWKAMTDAEREAWHNKKAVRTTTKKAKAAKPAKRNTEKKERSTKAKKAKTAEVTGAAERRMSRQW